jgi:hypothetical protein
VPSMDQSSADLPRYRPWLRPIACLGTGAGVVASNLLRLFEHCIWLKFIKPLVQACQE